MSGAAIASAASIVCVNAAAALEVNFLIGVRPFGRGYHFVAGAALVSFGVVAGALRYLLGSSLPVLVLAVVVAAAVYAALLWRYRRALRLDGLRTLMPGQLSVAGRPTA